MHLMISSSPLSLSVSTILFVVIEWRTLKIVPILRKCGQSVKRYTALDIQYVSLVSTVPAKTINGVIDSLAFDIGSMEVKARPV
jgi:hypothetical protein